MRRYSVLVALLLSACAGPATLIAGEAIRSPEPPAVLLNIQVIAADDASPVRASVVAGSETVTADSTGTAAVVWPENPLDLQLSAAGFLPQTVTVDELPEDSTMTVQLEPVVLHGVVLANDGRALPDATISTRGTETNSAVDGSFTLTRAVPGEIAVSRPAWLDTTVTWDGVSDAIEVVLEPRVIRGVRINSTTAGNLDRWQDLLDVVMTTGANAIVFDAKSEDGNVPYNTSVATAHEIGAVQVLYDVDARLADMDAAGIYKIIRIVTFQDSPMAKARPELAVWDKETNDIWRNHRGFAWVDPTDRNAWDYPIALAVEACQMGFDEVQFDYVRFPSDGPIDTMQFDGTYDQQNRVATIAAFLTEARSQIAPLGCAVSADIFAAVIETQTDEGIGQMPEALASAVDVISPMIYPTHYGSVWRGIENPGDNPLAILGGALATGIPRLADIGFAHYRPWLEFNPYDPPTVLAEIRIAEENNLGWMLWDGKGITSYDPSYLPGGS